MRILTLGNMYPPQQLGGAELVWAAWVEHARAAGHQVRVLTTDLRLPGTPADRAPDVARTLRWYWREHAFPHLPRRERFALERHNARTLDAELETFAPDVVVYWAMAGMSLGAMERVRRRGLPGVAVLGDYWLTYGPEVDGWLSAWAKRPRLGRLVARATGLPTRVHLDRGLRYVFISETLRRGALGTFPALTDHEVAHHGPDTALLRPAPRPPWRGRLLVLGRIDAWKGIELAIGALATLQEMRLTIVGSGDEALLAQLRAAAETAGVAARITWAGRRERAELPALFAEHDALLFPVTWEEPWGLVPSEAMAAGVPVVGSGRGGSGEYLRGGVNALLFDPDDGPAALAERVRELAADPALRERLRAGGLETVAALSAESFDARVQAAVDKAAGVPG